MSPQEILNALSVPARRRLARSARVAEALRGMLGAVPPIVFVGRRSFLAMLHLDAGPGEVLAVDLHAYGLDADERAVFCAIPTALRRLALASELALLGRPFDVAETIRVAVGGVARVVELQRAGDTLYVVVDDDRQGVRVHTVHVEAAAPVPAVSARGGAA